ncbi:amidase [Lichenihabitans sp. PAMC28606]|uniref:amidase n=1 Tax=Lichenihabitans sp. PAMC28606 TaxID=2880932 RepID=UPI001D0AB186|nr:amidase [Lichenihabitans sp. PAMC28606]UDL93199.1 amidase [Lichenihabitans sp. PAMC28606]
MDDKATPSNPETGDLSRRSATELARLIASRTVTSRAVVSAFLSRIETFNPTYNAIVSLRPAADILAEADRADEAVARGQTIGPLHGLPIAIKDLAATKGLRTTLGSPLYSDNVPDADALAVARVRGAGAIIIGKTNTPEFGLGSHTYNPIFGATRNAFDPSRSAGGSSGGAALALALSMLPIADGSDFGGSLRNPAAWNNVFGLRPSQGRVPSTASPDAFMSQLSTDGPMGRHVEDLALLLSVQAGHDARAPLSLDGTGFRYEQHLEEFGPARIAWLGDFGGHLPMENGVLDLCRSGLARLEALGCTIVPLVPAFDAEALWQAFVVLRQFSTGGKFMEHYRDPAKRALLKPEALWECEGYLALTAQDVYEAAVVRSSWYATLQQIFLDVDFLALPAAQMFPFPVETTWPGSIAGRPMDSYHRWMEVVAPVTLSGSPAISLPVGFGGEGGHLPMGVQIVGRPRDDLAVLRLAYAYERANPWIAAARG